MKMEDREARRKGFRFKRTPIFFVGAICIYIIGFSNFFCKNCKINEFVTQLPEFKNRGVNIFVDITNKTLKKFAYREHKIFEYSMLEANFVKYRKPSRGNYMIIHAKVPLSDYRPFGLYYTDTWVDIIFVVQNGQVITSDAMLRTVGL